MEVMNLMFTCMVYNVPEEINLNAGDLRRRTFVTIASNKDLEPINIHPFHMPIFHLYNLFSINERDLAYWENHFNHAESIMESIKAIGYYRSCICDTYNQKILPHVQEEYNNYINTEMGRLENVKEKKQIVFYTFKIDQACYYSFLSSIWMVLSLYYSVFEYFNCALDNIASVIKFVFDCRETSLSQNARRYLRDMKKMIGNIRAKINDYRLNSEQLLKKRNKNVHRMICGIRINWDSKDKEFYIVYTRSPLDFGDSYFKIDELFEKTNELQGFVERLFFEVFDESHRLLKENQLVLNKEIS